MEFKEQLRYYREQRGYSADELAKLIGVSYTTLKGYENAGREPKYNILIKIANVLKVSLDDLLGRTPISEDEQLKNVINDILSVSDIKYLKLDTINSEYVSFYLCGNDEQPIKHTSFRKKDILAIIERIKSDLWQKEKLTLYEWFSCIGIEKEIKFLNTEIDDIKKLKKLSEFEQLENINQNLITIKELQDLKTSINKKFHGSYEVISQNNK